MLKVEDKDDRMALSHLLQVLFLQILFNSSILQITAWLDTDTWHIVES